MRGTAQQKYVQTYKRGSDVVHELSRSSLHAGCVASSCVLSWQVRGLPQELITLKTMTAPVATCRAQARATCPTWLGPITVFGSDPMARKLNRRPKKAVN